MPRGQPGTWNGRHGAQMAYALNHRESGLCIDCPEPTSGGTIRCAYHRQLHNERARARKAKVRA